MGANKWSPARGVLGFLTACASIWLTAGARAELPAEVLEPRVTVEEFANRSEQAYWYNQRKLAIKVTPKHGAPYYLVDPDADGLFEMRRGGPDIDVKPTMWKLSEW